MASSSDQFKLFWSALGINQKVTIILSVFGVLALMVGMLWWASQPRMELLYSQMDTKDMAEVVELARGQGIPYRIEGNSVFVPAGSVAGLRMEAVSAGAVTSGSIGYEIFDQGNFGVSDFVQRTNKTRALQGELERAIETIDGVRKAQVLVVQKEDKLILQKYEDQPKASVKVDTGGRVLDNQQVIGIRNLVAFSVEGLSPENVAVVDNRGHALSDKVSESGELAMANSQIKFQRQLEEGFAQKVMVLLAPVYGAENLSIGVGVEVEHQAVTEMRDIFDPDSQVARNEQTEKESTESTEIQRDPIVGETPNTPVGLGGAVGGEPSTAQSESKRDRKNFTYEISRVTTETVRQPGKINAITATVIINKNIPSLEENIGGGADAGEGDGPTGRTEAELKEIHDQVASALGPMATTITVGEAVFSGLSGGDGAPNIRDEIDAWFQTFKGPIIVLIAVIMFFVFLRMVKKHKPAITPIEVLTQGDEDDMLANANVGPRPTPELLNELIQEKPDNVAQALKSWSSIK